MNLCRCLGDYLCTKKVKSHKIMLRRARKKSKCIKMNLEKSFVEVREYSNAGFSTDCKEFVFLASIYVP